MNRTPLIQTGIACAVLLFAGSTRAEEVVVLSEIMFDPVGSDSYDEYVEIVNLSEIEPVDLTGWRIGDGEELDQITHAGMGMVLRPGQIGLIVDSGYFEHSEAYEPLPADAFLLTIENGAFGKGGWSNTTPEPVILLNGEGEEVARYVYSLSNPPGISDEKIRLQAGDDPTNWADSRVEGGTPGRRNSVTPFLRDIGIYATDIRVVPPSPATGEPVDLTVVVHNLGTEPVRDIEIIAFEDMDNDSTVDEGESIADPEWIGSTLSWRDSAEVTFHYESPTPGFHVLSVVAHLQGDENPANNMAHDTLYVAFRSGQVVINEILFAPPSGGSEWVELFNRSDDPIDLRAWTLSDADFSSAQILTEERFPLPPEGYVVVVQDESTFSQDFPDILAPILVPPKWPSLNNTEDTIVLRDPTGRIMDRVSYRGSWLRERNVSLERIHPGLAGDDSTHWAGHVTEQGGTPGAQNSVYVERLPTEVSLSISPNPFDERTILSFHLPVTTAFANLWIYNAVGQRVRVLLDADLTGSERSVVWDGRDDHGDRLPMGIYVAYLEGLNAEKGVIYREKRTAVLARRL